MKFKSFQVFGLTAAILFGAAGAASAQTTAPAVEAERTVVATEDEGFDWGWLGLLGLIGLAGLAGRKKDDTARTSDVNRTNVYDKTSR